MSNSFLFLALLVCLCYIQYHHKFICFVSFSRRRGAARGCRTPAEYNNDTNNTNDTTTTNNSNNDTNNDDTYYNTTTRSSNDKLITLLVEEQPEDVELLFFSFLKLVYGFIRVACSLSKPLFLCLYCCFYRCLDSLNIMYMICL